jgi:hypothetical protein
LIDYCWYTFNHAMDTYVSSALLVCNIVVTVYFKV